MRTDHEIVMSRSATFAAECEDAEPRRLRQPVSGQALGLSQRVLRRGATAHATRHIVTAVFALTANGSIVTLHGNFRQCKVGETTGTKVSREKAHEANEHVVAVRRCVRALDQRYRLRQRAAAQPPQRKRRRLRHPLQRPLLRRPPPCQRRLRHRRQRPSHKRRRRQRP